MLIGLLVLLTCIIWILIGTSYFKIHPFLVLLSASIFLAIFIGIPINQIGPILGKGFGRTFESIGLLIIFGTIIGVILEKSNSTHTIALKILKLLFILPAPFIVSLIGYIVSIPVFCDSAFIILNSLNKSISNQTKTPIVSLTVALSTGLFAPHVLIPPTPGPLAAAANLELESLFLLIIFGGVIGLILVLVGAIFSYYLSKKYTYKTNKLNLENNLENSLENSLENNPPFLPSIIPIIIPIIFMSLGTIGGDMTSELIQFISQPSIALLFGMISSFYLLKYIKNTSFYEIIEKSIIIAAPILLITSIGGSIGLIVESLNIKTLVKSFEINSNFGILIPFIIASVMKSAQGSSTVSIITTSAIIFPLLPLLQLDSEMGKVWAILSLGCGSMTVSHVNDSYFWVVSQFGQLDVKTAYKTHTLGTLIQGLSGLILILIGFNIWKIL